MNYPEPVNLTRRSALALLAVTGLSGCSFSPIQWEDPEALPSPSPSGDGAVEVRSDYFAQSPDTGDRTLSEGIPVSLRIATPHFDAWLDRRFHGKSLGAVTTAQVRESTAIRAPEGHELIAFTLKAGTPAFSDSGTDGARVAIIAGDSLHYPLAAPFGPSYDRGWALYILTVPEGVPVVLTVTDEGKVVTVDLRTGEPEADEPWRANRGFRERVAIEIVEGPAILERDLLAVVNGQQLRSRFRLGLDPQAPSELVPWNPESGWAEENMQWLWIAMNAKVEFVPSDPAMLIELDVPGSFSYREAQADPIPAHLPRMITTEAIQRQSQDLDVRWAVPGAATDAQFDCSPVGVAVARFSDHPDVAAEFTGAPSQQTWTLKFTPKQ